MLFITHEPLPAFHQPTKVVTVFKVSKGFLSLGMLRYQMNGGRYVGSVCVAGGLARLSQNCVPMSPCWDREDEPSETA